MNILLFEGMPAEPSLALATETVNGAPAIEGWEEGFQLFVSVAVPALRAVPGVPPSSCGGGMTGLPRACGAVG
jgi:hypothetical protein